jgi:RNA polymerase sigma-70 factor, ECF subfamily
MSAEFDWDMLYTQHWLRIYRLGLAWFHNSEEAEDVVQSAFLLAYKARHRFDPNLGSFGTWLYQIAINYCRSVYRRNQEKYQAASLDELAESGFDIPDSLPGPEKQTITADINHRLLKAIDGLPIHLQSVVIPVYFLEMSQTELAPWLCKPEGTVYSSLHNAREQLRQELGGDV